MIGVNNVVVAGMVDRKPWARDVGNSKKAGMTVVVRSTYRGRDGETKETKDYIEVIAWGRAAEAIEFVQPGSAVVVTGSIRNEKEQATDDEGNAKYRQVVNALSVHVDLAASQPSPKSAPAQRELPVGDEPF